MSVLATWAYQLNTDGETYAVRCNNRSTVTEAVVPNTYTTGGVTYPVTKINSAALNECPNLTKVTIPASITSFGANAFGTTCPNLTRVDYEGTVAQWCNIDMGDTNSTPFQSGASLYINNEEAVDIVIPKTVATIKPMVFAYYSKLETVVMENRTDNITQSIGERAFFSCSNLSKIILSNNLTSIGIFAFRSCTSLKKLLIPENVNDIGNYAFSNCSNLDECILTRTVPSVIGVGIFNSTPSSLKIYCYMTSLSAYQSATNWKTYKDKMIADDLRIYFILNSISAKSYFASKDYVLAELAKFGQVDDVKVDNQSIVQNKIANIDTMSNIDIDFMFPTEGLAYTLNSDNQSYSCSGIGTATDTDIIIAYVYENLPVTKISDNAFAGQPITGLVIPQSITEIGGGAFSHTNIEKLVLPDSIQSIGIYLNEGNKSLLYFDTGDGISIVTGAACQGCEHLKKCIIGENVTLIGNNTFFDNYALTTIIFKSFEPPIPTNFQNANLYVPYRNIDAYKIATNWVSYTSVIYPLVNTLADLASIDITAYTKACVIGNDEYTEYTYNGSQWNIVS